jgi:hypothetical protein
MSGRAVIQSQISSDQDELDSHARGPLRIIPMAHWQAPALATCLDRITAVEQILTITELPREHARALRVSIIPFLMRCRRKFHPTNTSFWSIGRLCL